MEYLISTRVLETVLLQLDDGDVAEMLRREIRRRELEAAQRARAAMS
jgi:hypothetical protein